MRINYDDLLSGLSSFENKTVAAIKIYGDAAAKKLEKEAKRGAPWTDRTGLSRKTIEGGCEPQDDKVVIYVAGNTEHFLFLELCHDKQFATLQPAVTALSPEILRGLNNLLGR